MNKLLVMKVQPAILVFCRPYLVESFKKICEPLQGEYDFRYLTDGLCPGTLDTRERFYRALKAGSRSPEISPEDEMEVIDRCRMLRNIDHAMAARLVHAMAVTLGQEMDRAGPSGVLSQMVDEYVTHLLWLLTSKRGIGYVGFCAGYFPSRSLLLADAYGRPFNYRRASDPEVEEVLSRIGPKEFRQNYNLSGDYRLSKHLFNLFRYRAKQLVFAIRRRVQRDPWNIHYAVTPFVADKRRLRDYPAESYFSSDWKDELLKLRSAKPDAPVFYLPLGYFPESSTDYWISNKKALNYEALIPEIARTLTRDSIVVVKEHLHMMGSRNSSFLRELRDIPGVVSAHPKQLSNEIALESDAVLLGSGSPGIEATVRGKPVFSFCDTSYWFEPSRATWLDLDRIGDWSEVIRARLADFEAPGPEDLREFVRACLESSTRVDPAVTFWPMLDENDLRNVLGTMVGRQAQHAEFP